MTSFEPLPHAWPFRFADRSLERDGERSGSVRAVLSSGGRVAGHGPLTAGYAAELMAQAALLLSGGDADLGRSGFLAGLSDVRMLRAPGPGEALTVRVTVRARLGPVVKLDATIHDRDGALVARGAVTVREGNLPGEGRS